MKRKELYLLFLEKLSISLRCFVYFWIVYTFCVVAWIEWASGSITKFVVSWFLMTIAMFWIQVGGYELHLKVKKEKKKCGMR